MSWFTRLLYGSPTGSAPSRTDAAGVNRLGEAVEADDLPQVQALLAQGVDPNSRLSEWPILIFALARGRMVIADYLIMGGADPNSSGGADTALTLAIEKGNARVVRSLIEAGADVNMRGGFGNLTPKEHAVHQSNSEIIRLIDHASGADTMSPAARLRVAAGVGDVAGVTQLLGSGESFDSRQLGAALQWAARNNHGPETVEIVRALLSAGADIDYHDEEDPHTPVTSAAKSKNVELLRFLIDGRADPTIGYGKGNSAMYLCNLGLDETEKQISDLLKSARPRQFDNDAMVAAASAGASELVRQALDAGIDANAKSKQGECLWPALVVAADSHDLKTVELLLHHGADPNCEVEGSPAFTPLRNAVRTQDEAILRALIAAGADLNHRTPSGEDAIDLAYWCGAREIAQILIEAKMHAPSS